MGFRCQHLEFIRNLKSVHFEFFYKQNQIYERRFYIINVTLAKERSDFRAFVAAHMMLFETASNHAGLTSVIRVVYVVIKAGLKHLYLSLTFQVR